MAIALDTLAYARRLREAGFTEQQAEGQAQAIETVFQAVHQNDADPKLLAWQYLQTLPQLAKGEGSTFIVSFPLAAPAMPAPAPNARPAAQAGADAGPDPHAHLLLVEDNEDTRFLVESLLEDRCQVTAAANAEEALAAAGRSAFDLVLMDINLGNGPDGNEVLHRLRTMSSFQHVPVVALTAYALPGDREHFLRNGFNAYLSKPFTADELLDKVTEMLGSAKFEGRSAK